MKKYLNIVPALTCLLLANCQKEKVVTAPNSDTQAIATASGSGSGGDGGGSGGGGATPTGFLQGVLSGTASRLVATKTDSVLVTFTQLSPAGWVLNITSSNPAAAQVPSTFPVPAGVRGVYVPVTGGQITNGVFVTITVRLNAESKSTTIKVFPLTATFPAPQLQSPGDGANFKSREIITFQWNANNNAYFYQLQIAPNTAFTNPETNLLLNDPFWRQSAFVALTNFWRVRFVDASGNRGPWSQVRRFEIRTQ